MNRAIGVAAQLPHHQAVNPAGQVQAWLLGLLMALGSLVFVEPAPYDILAIALFVGLLAYGLRIPRELHSATVLLGLFVAGNILAAAATPDPLQALRSLSIRTYMVLAWLLLTSLIVLNPERMLRALWAGYLVAAVIAVGWGCLEYFGLIKGELWQGGLRAKGPFKDPNVFGPFIVPAAVYCLLRLTRAGGLRTLVFGPLLLFFLFGVLLSFSRGAWINMLLSTGLFVMLSIAYTKTLRGRLNWLLAGLLASALLVALITSAVSVESIGERFFQRAVLTQKYDTASGGRFASQAAAINSISENPIGVGPGRSAVEFGLEPHNLYLHILVEGGWLAGFGFLSFLFLTGFQLIRAIRNTRSFRGETIAVFACLIGVLFQSLFIDSTHWRHLWLLFAVAWALIIVCRRSQFIELTPTFMSSPAANRPARRYAQ